MVVIFVAAWYLGTVVISVQAATLDCGSDETRTTRARTAATREGVTFVGLEGKEEKGKV